MQSPLEEITVVHSHPSESSLSSADLANPAGVREVIAVSPTGSLYRAEGTDRSTGLLAEMCWERICLVGDSPNVKVDHALACLWGSHIANLILHDDGIMVYKAKLSPSAQQDWDAARKGGLKKLLDALRLHDQTT
jgi:hypothetical protein